MSCSAYSVGDSVRPRYTHLGRRVSQMGDEDMHHVVHRLLANHRGLLRVALDRPRGPRQALAQVDAERLGVVGARRSGHAV